LLDGYQVLNFVVDRLANNLLQLIDGCIGAMLQAVIDDILCRNTAGMEGLAYLIGARSIDIDKLTRVSITAEKSQHRLQIVGGISPLTRT
jgi:hypothetical protein